MNANTQWVDIEIYITSSGVVVSKRTLTKDAVAGFAQAWLHNCKTDEYNWRYASDYTERLLAPKPLTVLKLADGLHTHDATVERMTLTDALCRYLAARNANLTAEQIKTHLISGRAIYTSFRRFILE